MRQRILAVGILVGVAAGAADVEWFQWRGPKRDGISTETGLLQEWPAGGPALAWKAKGLGNGYSVVTFAPDRIFTMGEKDDAACVFALERSSGKIVWSTPVGKAGAPGWGNFAGPRSTPTVDGELVYAVGQYGEIVCLQAASGAKAWAKSFVTDLGGKVPEWGYSESPLLAGDKILCTPGGSKGAIVALDKKSGAVLWQCKELTDGAAYSSLVPAKICGLDQYVQLTPASVAGVGPDGKLLWRAAREGKTAVIPTPICSGDNVYVTSGYGVGCNLFTVTASGGALTAKQVFANKTIANHHGGVILLGDHVYGYCDSKGWVCQKFATGEIVWSDKKLGKGSIAYADGRFYLRTEAGKGTVALIEATPEGYKEKGRFDQPDRSKANSWPHPVIAGGKLYLRDQDVLLCYDIKAK